MPQFAADRQDMLADLFSIDGDASLLNQAAGFGFRWSKRSLDHQIRKLNSTAWIWDVETGDFLRLFPLPKNPIKVSTGQPQVIFRMEVASDREARSCFAAMGCCLPLATSDLS